MLKLIYSKKANAETVLTALIKNLKLQVSTNTIQNCLDHHPDYPSLLALSDCLTEWKIPNNSYQIDKNDYNPDDLSFPLIAYLQKNRQFILINNISKGAVTYTNEQKKSASMPERDFLRQWGGVILYAEATPESGETAYKTQRFRGILDQLRIPALVSTVAACILYVFFQYNITWVFTALTALTLVGLIVSILLLIYSVNASNPFIQNLCSLGKNNDCNAILKSKEAKVTDWLSWSEVGFFYFAGSLLSLLLVNNAASFLAILNLCCLPYTFWSLWYQYRAKNWCVLCCTVQVLLWLQFTVFAAGIGYGIRVVELTTIIAMLFSFIIPMVVWFFVKPFMLKAEQLVPLKKQLKKFKYNNDLFNQILTNQQRFSVPNDIMPIVLGNTEATNVITMVSNPFCGPCATTHKTLDQWLNTRDDIQVKVVFTTANHDDDPKTKVARHLTALSLLGDKRVVGQALNDWYNSARKDYGTWAKDYPVQDNGEMELVMQKQKEWCELTEVKFTPTLLVNGYKLPDPYSLDDIKYLLS